MKKSAGWGGGSIVTEREACIIFNMISGVGYGTYRKLEAHFGSPLAALTATPQELQEVPGIGEALAARIAGWRGLVDFEGEMAFADANGVRILTLRDEAYPEILRQLYDPPLVLYIRGALPEFGNGNALTVVGSRRISRYGEEITARLTADAVAAGMVIVSGLAMGADTVAHRTAVDNGGITVAVLGSGLARLHPAENVPLARRIIETGGAVISEFPLHFPASRSSFPRRNRIVARLGDGVLVTECGIESGAMITAGLAAEYGVVMAVPGRVDNPQSRGCHKLIKSGAALIEDFADIAEAMGFGNLPLSDQPEPDGLDPRNGLPEDAAGLLALLQEGEKSFDDLAAATGYDSGRLISLLTLLELQLLVRHSADQVYALR
ncbi:MAG: DNA-processing protein DprA [Lentisphaeria bacterium]|nr:DNA-processing protein DprA [Lentisphaeria bacterium]